MATTNNDDLARKLGDTPDRSPEDTKSELLEKLDTKSLRRNEVNDPNQSPEDTRAELLDRKAVSSIENRAEKLAMSQGGNPDAFKVMAIADANDFKTIKNPSWQESAAVQMAVNIGEYPNYKTELDRVEPGITEKVLALDAANTEKMIAKEERKAGDMVSMLQERQESTKNWTQEEAALQAQRDSQSYKASASEYERGYMRDDMAFKSGLNQAYQVALEKIAPEISREAQAAKVAAVTPAAPAFKDDTATIRLAENDAKQKSDFAAKRQAENDLTERKERERIQAAQGLNSFDMQKKKGDFKQGDLMLPISVKNAYTVVEGKFYAKDSNRIMFEDKGNKLVTSTTDKKTIADMVAHAKGGNNQWVSIKLSGSQEFRREAWLQAESQGVKTSGYTPKEKDLAELENLTKERQKNSIMQATEKPTEKAKEKEVATVSAVIAPRHDLNKNQAVLDAEANKNIPANVVALQKSNSFNDQHSIADMNKLAYMRGLVMARDKLEPAHVQAESLARFDAQVKENPNLAKSIDMTEATAKEKTIDRVQERNEPELSR